jgi:excisionase family DNA binding protein
MPKISKPAALTGEKLAYTIPQAAALSSISRATIYREMETGALASIKVRKRRLVTAEALKRWLKNAEAS